MAEYKNTILPGDVGGPGPFDEVEITVTAGAESTPVKAADTLEAYYALSTADTTRHDRFADIVRYFQQYGQPVSIASDDDQVITLKFERQGMFEHSSIGKAPWDDTANRPNAIDLADAYVADNDYSVSVIAIKVNGVSQTN